MNICYIRDTVRLKRCPESPEGMLFLTCSLLVKKKKMGGKKDIDVEMESLLVGPERELP